MDSICISKGKSFFTGARACHPVVFWGPGEVIDTIAGADMRPYLNK
jgi:hypothetical protein